MIIEEIKHIKSDKKELRKFGITMGIVLGLLGGVLLWRGKPASLYLFTIAAVFLFFGFALPRLLKPVHKFWMTLSILMGWVMTRVILIVLFYLIMTPIGLIARLCGKDFLGLEVNKKATSYWIPRNAIEREKSSYENQF
ncbi:MAG: SxtJ family membrane protein [Proteobacteria bacterium]|nr:SxtJ family membrane protein [Pseudomonadota bacterium]